MKQSDYLKQKLAEILFKQIKNWQNRAENDDISPTESKLIVQLATDLGALTEQIAEASNNILHEDLQELSDNDWKL